MRTRQQEIARHRWLKPSAVAAELDCDDDLVRDHIKAGDFPDVDKEPGVINIGGGKVPQYRINPRSLEAFIRQSKVEAA